MSGEKVIAFLDAPYWAVSDVKMLHFFTKMSGTTMVVLAILTILFLFFPPARYETSLLTHIKLICEIVR
jgi:hypothetical protein